MVLQVATGASVFGTACDVSDPQSIRKLAQEAQQRLGQIDVWINNAGYSGCFQVSDSFPFLPNLLNLGSCTWRHVQYFQALLSSARAKHCIRRRALSDGKLGVIMTSHFRVLDVD